MFADELSTHYVVTSRDLGDVISTVHTDAEITPPLYFAARVADDAPRADTAELLRAPSLLAGAAAIPLVYCWARAPSGAGRRSSPRPSRRSRRS